MRSAVNSSFPAGMSCAEAVGLAGLIFAFNQVRKVTAKEQEECPYHDRDG